MSTRPAPTLKLTMGLCPGQHAPCSEYEQNVSESCLTTGTCLADTGPWLACCIFYKVSMIPAHLDPFQRPRFAGIFTHTLKGIFQRRSLNNHLVFATFVTYLLLQNSSTSIKA
ncbi:hypothetical protein HanPI659440_Chr02g0079091 [Helianthus annuus]|nr:hypothetical protein HanPI659440_Chr02g0079091 [Helianthus annuus]